MHKVVEHVHAWLDAEMQKWLEGKEGEKVTPEDCMAELVRLFEEGYPQEAIQKDVESLPETYRAVVAARGGYIPAPLR
jgi:hypothetical protein